MIISVDTVRDSPDAMKAAARLILELAGESTAPREPAPARVEPERPVPEPRASPRPVTPEPVAPRVVTPVVESLPKKNGFEELGLEVYDENEPTPRSVSVTIASRKDEERKAEAHKAEKPSTRLSSGVQVY